MVILKENEMFLDYAKDEFDILRLEEKFAKFPKDKPVLKVGFVLKLWH